MTELNDPAVIKGIVIGFGFSAVSFTFVAAWLVRELRRAEKDMIERLNQVAEKFRTNAELIRAFAKSVKRIDD